MLLMTLAVESRGCGRASRLSSNSSRRFTGKRAAPVLIVLLRMKSARSKLEKKCALPEASTVVALVIPLGAKAHGANAGRTKPLEQPGPSPGTLNGPAVLLPVVVAPTANALACRMASGRFQCSVKNDAVADHGPTSTFVEAWPPRTYESWPEEFSL